MKPVAVAVALGVTVFPAWRSPFNIINRTRYGLKLIRIARMQLRIRKVFRIVRRRRQELQFISNSLAFAAFSVFIVWDTLHLSHDEPGDIETKRRSAKTQRLRCRMLGQSLWGC